ncbi:MAG: hypothetical protein B0A82_15625 [Alkalinema sp. CACIAM 70d]|nr:MAG: hypothetical protein B0A82_15625 [Alkalinema sp. CACIAM 70d]
MPTIPIGWAISTLYLRFGYKSGIALCTSDFLDNLVIAVAKTLDCFNKTSRIGDYMILKLISLHCFNDIALTTGIEQQFNGILLTTI